MMILPLILMFGVSPLTVLHIYPLVLGRINIKRKKVSKPYYSGTVVGIFSVNHNKNSHYKKPVHTKPLILTSVLIFIGFFVVHVFSIISFIQYGQEVLSSKDYHSIIPITHAVLSLLAIVVGFVLTVIFFTIRISKSKQHQDPQHQQQREQCQATLEWKERRQLRRQVQQPQQQDQQQQQQEQQQQKVLQQLLIPAAVISMNFIYIGCYFMPYMLLAFIHDPLLTTLTYLTLALFIVCIYLICLGVWNLYKLKHKIKHDNNKREKFSDYILYSCMVWAMAFSLSMFLFVVTYILTLGSFDDFRDIKYLMPSLPLAVVSLFLIKPLYKLKKQDPDSNRKAEEGDMQRMEDTEPDDNQICTTEFNETSSSFSDSQTQVLPDNIHSST